MKSMSGKFLARPQLADKVSIFVETSVTPAKAGVQVLDIALDSRLRGNDIYAKLGLKIKFMGFVNCLTCPISLSDNKGSDLLLLYPKKCSNKLKH